MFTYYLWRISVKLVLSLIITSNYMASPKYLNSYSLQFNDEFTVQNACMDATGFRFSAPVT